MEQFQLEIQKQHREKYDKYIYYLIALTVSAIGYSIYLTLNQPLKYSQIPLGFAVLFWGCSVYLGLSQLKIEMHLLYLDNEKIDLLAGNNPKTGSHPEKIKIGFDVLTNIINKQATRISNHGYLQDRFFYAGTFLFVIWHLLEMYLRTK